MAFNLNLQTLPCSLSGFSPRIFPLKPFLRSSFCLAPRHVHCLASTHQNNDPSVARRTANYQPSIWDFDFIQSVKSDWTGKMCERRAEKLENVRCMINVSDVGLLDRLELIDDVGRLGLGYIFEEEIKTALDEIAIDENNINVGTNKGLHVVALRFRLLRQHGYEISQDVFNGFKDDMGNFKASLCEDVRGMLSLFEASHLALEGENILDEAKYFTTTYLNNLKGSIAPNLEKKVNHSLELPLHQRMLRLEARWYIEMCKSEGYIHPDLLGLAMLDFNMVQAIHQKDMRDSSRWWRDLGLGSHSELSFSRDRLMENFLWTIGVIFDPQYDYCRKELTKVNALITTIDDVYDVYGTLDELQLFTDAVERWDINAMEQLPNYMKICFLSLYNTVNQMAYDTLKEQGWDIIPYLKKAWVDLCKSYLVEAKWYHNKYTPTLEEYLNNAWISISGPAILVHTYFFVKQEITMDSLECLERYPDIIRWSSMILRLCDDMGTSTAELERGDVPKSIQCYMRETGASEEVAREHIKHLISDTWKKMNKDRVDDSIFPQPFIGTAVNLARMAQCMYQYGDGHGVPDRETKDRVLSLLVEPISPKEIKPTNLVAI